MTASGTEYTIVSLEKGTPVHGGSWITFEAPEDNYYTFSPFSINKAFWNATLFVVVVLPLSSVT